MASQRVFSTTSNLVLLNSGVLDKSALLLSDYGANTVNVVLGTISTLASKALEIESDLKSLGIAGKVKGMAASDKISVKIANDTKSFTLQDSLTLVNSHLLPLGSSWDKYILGESGPEFVLSNLENSIQLGLITSSNQVNDLMVDIKTEATDQAFIFYLVISGCALVTLILGNWSILKNWSKIEKELFLSYGFSMDDCSNLREGLEQIMSLLVAAGDRVKTSDTVSLSSASRREDEVRASFNVEKQADDIKRRKKRGSLARQTLANMGYTSAFIVLILAVSCGLVFRFASNYSDIVDQNIAFGKMVKISFEMSSRISLVKVFMLNALFNTSYDFKGQSPDALMKKHTLDNNGEALVNFHKVLLEKQSFLTSIEGGVFYDQLTTSEICKLYDQNKAAFVAAFVKSQTGSWFSQSCQAAVDTIMADNQLNKGINGLVTRLNTYISRIQEAIYLVLKEKIAPPMEDSCPTLDWTVQSNRENNAKCLLSSVRFQQAGSQQ